VRASFVGVLLLVGLASAGCGAAQSAAPASARVPAAFVKQLKGTQVEGEPVVAVRPTGVSLSPTPGGTLGVLIVVRNQTDGRLTLEDVRAIVPHGSFVRPLGARLSPYYKCHPYCTRHFVMRGPYGAESPTPVKVYAKKAAQAQLDFAIAGCGALKTASTEPIKKAVLVYRNSLGTTVHQTIGLKSSRLQLRPSGRIACKA
jgi:hypothetical protein